MTLLNTLVIPKLILVAICLIPVAVLLPQIHFQRRKLKLSKKSPFTDLLLRPAGEGLRLKILELDEKLNDHLLNALVFPLILAGVLFFTIPSGEQALPVLLAGVPVVGLFIGATYLIWGPKISGLWRKIRDYELGFQGERYVGEELNQLLKDGFWVFHDLPFNGFNIDHVLVGPPGVYAVETKTRRKTIGEKGTAAHKVTYDGKNLHFPSWTDNHGLEQAKRNADHLASWLSSATGEKVKVEPILTLPGWWVERTSRGTVHVVKIPRIFPRNPPFPLSPEQIQRISHQIEQKCRNLEV